MIICYLKNYINRIPTSINRTTILICHYSTVNLDAGLSLNFIKLVHRDKITRIHATKNDSEDKNPIKLTFPEKIINCEEWTNLVTHAAEI